MLSGASLIQVLLLLALSLLRFLLLHFVLSVESSRSFAQSLLNKNLGTVPPALAALVLIHTVAETITAKGEESPVLPLVTMNS